MKYLVNMLYYVIPHIVVVWETVHNTKHDYIDVFNATQFKNTCEKYIKISFLWCFCRDCCRYYYVIKTSPNWSLDWHGLVQSDWSNAGPVQSSLWSFAVLWTGPESTSANDGKPHWTCQALSNKPLSICIKAESSKRQSGCCAPRHFSLVLQTSVTNFPVSWLGHASGHNDIKQSPTKV